jgi:hypothetical protein
MQRRLASGTLLFNYFDLKNPDRPGGGWVGGGLSYLMAVVLVRMPVSGGESGDLG